MLSVCPVAVAETITEHTDETEAVTSDSNVAAAAAYSETFTHATISASQPVYQTYYNGATYVTISTCQSNTSSTGMVLAVKDAQAVKAKNIDLAIKGSPPSKDQEFYIVAASGYPGEYHIFSRLTGECLQMGTNNTANGTNVLNRFPYITAYNRWRLIPVYKVGEDYTYTSYGKIPSTVDYGISAKYNITSLQNAVNNNLSEIDCVSLANTAFDAWTNESARITLEADNIYSPNYIYFSTDARYENGGAILGWTTPKSTIINGFVTKDIYIYNPNIKAYAESINDDYELVWLSTLVHELGHTLGLGDIGNIDSFSDEILTANPNLYDSIMVYRDIMSDVVVPHEAEFAGVKKAYHATH